MDTEDVLQKICGILKIQKNDITDFTMLKKGMTNKSFVFSCNKKRYIIRVPGEGTDRLIDRTSEANVYHAIEDYELCDYVIYIDPENGYKITEFLEDARVCNPYNMQDVKKCMDFLRMFHEEKLKVNHEFRLFEQIKFYEELRGNMASVYSDYQETKENIYSLKSYIENHIEEKVLTHIDAVSDNFLFYTQEGKEKICLIDWEYAGMQDPHLDIAMFAIYSGYDKKQIDQLISIYFDKQCDTAIRIKIYCYIAAGGLLWSNWCEYKRVLGVEFGDYAKRQYQYAKEYYKIVQDELKN